jgi:hypothetical protein
MEMIDTALPLAVLCVRVYLLWIVNDRGMLPRQTNQEAHDVVMFSCSCVSMLSIVSDCMETRLHFWLCRSVDTADLCIFIVV